MTILVGYIPSPEGDAALDRAIVEAKVHAMDLVVLNASRGEAILERRRLYEDQAESLTGRLDASGGTSIPVKPVMPCLRPPRSSMPT